MTEPQKQTPGFSFRTLAKSGHARTGILTTPHGDVPTPTFMPVGTQGSVKTLRPAEVAETGARIVLGNTYHLWLRPGPEVVAELGGLHKFTKWPHAMLTDSGGFQAFSLAERRKTTEEGFVFRSHIDGSKKELSPEIAMRVQGQLGADIAMQLDICPPGDAPKAEVEKLVKSQRVGLDVVWRANVRIKRFLASSKAEATPHCANFTPTNSPRCRLMGSRWAGFPWRTDHAYARSPRRSRAFGRC